MSDVALLTPNWPTLPRIVAGVTTRLGGVSLTPYHSFNLASHVGDNPAHVATNRHRLQTLATLPASPVWLNQTHSTRVAYLDNNALPSPNADAVWTDQPNIPCAVLTADCLPILLARQDGQRIAAIHAGWRGAAKGIIENTLDAVCAGEPKIGWQAWLGPCIGPTFFEVGDDVWEAFCAPRPIMAQFFMPTEDQKWLFDLPGAAAEILRQKGVLQVAFSQQCTYSDPARWYSYRREPQTGRQASFLCILPS